MLRKVLNYTWKDKIKNEALYGSIPKVSEVIRSRRLKLAGHAFRDKSSPVHNLITWLPTQGYASKGRPKTTFITSMLHDTNTSTVSELHNLMNDKDLWRSISRCHPSL